MEVLLKPVEVVASFTPEGRISPIRFRVITEETGYETIYISTISRRRRERTGKSFIDIYTCTGQVMGKEKLLELKHEIATGEWSLYRM